MKNLDAIVRFCCRGAGSPGAKQFGAPLADPYAKPNMDWAPEVLLDTPLHRDSHRN
jgi:glutathione S-transferase